MKETEYLVDSWLKEEFSLTAVRYTKREMRLGLKTPDFKVHFGEVFEFYCEVKAVLGNTKIVRETTPNQLTNDIHNAYKKFKDVNGEHHHPNVLALVNQDLTAGVDYLEDVITGHWFMDNRKAYPFYCKYSEGRIKEEKTIIDLFLWFEQNGKVFFRFSCVNDIHFEKLCTLLKIDSLNLRRRGMTIIPSS